VILHKIDRRQIPGAVFEGLDGGGGGQGIADGVEDLEGVGAVGVGRLAGDFLNPAFDAIFLRGAAQYQIIRPADVNHQINHALPFGVNDFASEAHPITAAGVSRIEGIAGLQGVMIRRLGI